MSASRETQIITLWDEGLQTRQIAQRLGLTERRVGSILSAYIAHEPGQNPASYAAGTARLLAAIARHHPERVQGQVA